MKTGNFLVLFLLLLGSCKSKKNIVESGGLKALSVKKIIKKHNAISFNAKTLEAKLKINYSDNQNGKRNRISFNVRLRMQKDSVIWMKGSYSILSAFRAKITPTTLSYYSLIDKKYFIGDYSLLENILGTKITFKQLQNLLLGESILDLRKEKYLSEIDDLFYRLTPKEQQGLYHIFFFFDPINFKLRSQLLQVTGENKTLQISYNNYINYNSQLIPKKIIINARKTDQYTNINIDFKSVILNKKISVPYRIPSNYKPIRL
tara:strand:- start:19404 stop:20186 length:783 start_codon:yes stop_codon:yes gene_type:complete